MHLGEFCRKNRLQLNKSKTHFLQIQSYQRRGAHGSIDDLLFGGEVVSSSTCESILGVQVSRNLFSWREHTDKLLEELSTVMCGLRMGAQYFSFKQRLATAKSCHFSKMYYCLEVWGHGLTVNQLRMLQSAQNKVLRWVTATPPRTSSLANIETCGVLSVRQEIAYRTLLAGMIILYDKKPEILYLSLLRGDQSGGDEIHLKSADRGYYEDRFWRNVFLRTFSDLPESLRQVLDVKKRQNKIGLRSWVRENIPMFYG